MESKFLKLYNIIMEDLITNKSKTPIKLTKTNEEYQKALEEIKEIVDKFTELLTNEFKDELLENEKFEAISVDKSYIIKCPNRLRVKFMQKTPFLTKEISDKVENGSLINNNYIIKINNINSNNSKSKQSFNKISNNVNDIIFQKSGASSVGEYVIPIIVKSNENDDDFYKFTVKLFAKPNNGATANREGNISITIAEFIPCLLWNKNANENISIDEIVNLIKNYNLNDSKYSINEKSKQKIQKLILYFKNIYDNIDNASKKLINNKLYGAISIYKFMKDKFSEYSQNECIWTDIDALKPKNYKNNPGDIMINKGNDEYISISLKTAERESENPPIKNATVESFLKFCNSISDNEINIIKDYFEPMVNFAKENDIFTDEEVSNLEKLKSNQNKMSSYINNSDIADKCLKQGELRDFAINKLIEIINMVFQNKEDLMNYFLQVQKGDSDFYILKAIEKDGASPKQISLNYEIQDDFNINPTKVGFEILGFTINNTKHKIVVEVRSKGHGLHAYLSYDLVSKLK